MADVKRGVLTALGVVLLLVGIALAAAGGVTAAVMGSDGSISTSPARVSGDGVALVVDEITVDAGSIPVPEGLGTLTLVVSSPAGTPMFAGSATTADVDTYLTAAPYDVVVTLVPGGEGETRAVPGTQQPPPPAAQPFWVRQASGSQARLSATRDPGTTLVVMNADASPAVTADVIVTLTVARAWTASWIAVGIGVVLMVLAGVSFWRASVARRRLQSEASTPRHAAGESIAATVLPGESTQELPDAPDPPIVVLPVVGEAVVDAEVVDAEVVEVEVAEVEVIDAEAAEDEVAEPAAPPVDVSGFAGLFAELDATHSGANEADDSSTLAGTDELLGNPPVEGPIVGLDPEGGSLAGPDVARPDEGTAG